MHSVKSDANFKEEQMTDKKTEEPKVKSAVEKAQEHETVGTNIRSLPFLQDQRGAMKTLRDGGIKSARRIGTSETRLDEFLATLVILSKFAKETHAENKRVHLEKLKNAASASQRVAERRLRDAENEAKKLSDLQKLHAEQIEDRKKELAALKGE